MTRTAADTETVAVAGWSWCKTHANPTTHGCALPGTCKLVALYREPDPPDPDAYLVEAAGEAIRDYFYATGAGVGLSKSETMARTVIDLLRDRGECFHPDHQRDDGPGSWPFAVSPKMLRETMCIAQGLFFSSSHICHIQQVIDWIDLHRPLGNDGKHGDLHTPTCGCDRETEQP